jgi:hypothetical protein
MDRPIQQMSLSDYAELQTRFGVKVIGHNGQFWRQVRPFFYRPLLPVESFQETVVQPPAAWPSGYQYVVANGQPANSTMNFLMLEDLAGYSLGSLTHKRRQLIKRAAQQFQVRPLRDPRELKAQGHGVYLSFYNRTRYPYKADRQDKAVFEQWVDTLFSSPKTILLGGYGPEGLASISTSYWVNHTLVYSMLLCETAALKKNLGELMFHELRVLAAQHPGIKEVFVRSYQGGNTLDQYYLHRDCRLVRKPARLEISSPIQTLIRWIMPRKYELLCGDD